MAHSAFDIRFNDEFIAALKLIEGFIGAVVLPFELLIVNPVVRWFREQGFTFELHEHWRNAFVLLWLFFASEMRAFASTSHNVDGKEGAWSFLNAFRWVWAAIVALLGGTLAGTVPLDHAAVLWWPVTAYFLLEGGDGFIQARKDRLYAAEGAVALVLAFPFAALALGWIEPYALAGAPPFFWWPAAAYFAWVAVVSLIWVASRRHVSTNRASTVINTVLAAGAGALALGVVPSPEWLDFEQSSSPGLANLAVFVVILAAGYLLYAFLDHDEGDESAIARVFRSTSARTALDVFAVLGGAAIIVYLAHLLS